MPKTLTAIVLSLLLSCMLTGCGDSDPGGGVSASGDGAATPEALIARAKEAATSQDMGEMFACIYPKHRAGMAYFMGVMPIQMMISMAEMFSGMGDAEQASEMKTQLIAMKEKHAALLAKYDVPMMAEDDVSMRGRNQAAMLETLHDKMGSVDHVGFVNEAMALLEKHATAGQKKGGSPVEEMQKEFGKPVAEIKKDGPDMATVRFEGQEAPKIVLRRLEGRWFLCLEQPGG